MTRAARTTGSTRRSPGRVHSASPVAASGRDRLLIWASIGLLTLLAWAYLVHLDRQMSSAMEHDTMMAEMGMAMDMRWGAEDLFFGQFNQFVQMPRVAVLQEGILKHRTECRR